MAMHRCAFLCVLMALVLNARLASGIRGRTSVDFDGENGQLKSRFTVKDAQNATKAQSSAKDGKCSRLRVGSEIVRADPSWELQYVEEGADNCHCDCKKPECFECTEGLLHAQDDGPICMSASQTAPEKHIVRRSTQPCGQTGVLELVNGKPMCSVPSECPPAPTGTGFEAKALSQCSCTYVLTCDLMKDAALVQTSVDNDDLVCEYRAPPRAIEGRPLDGKLRCVHPLTLHGNKCVLDQPCPSAPLTLSPEALACGPQTSRFIGLMFDEMMRQQTENSYNAMQLSCVTNCVSVFAKMSECFEQHDISKCLGVDSASTRNTQARDYLTKDSSAKAKWLVKSKGTVMPCHSVFASRRTFSSTTEYEQIVGSIQESAEERYVALQGDYNTFPTKSISCRDGFCKKIATMTRRSKPVVTAAECYEHCRESHKNKKP